MAPIFSTSGGYESVNGGAVIREGPVYGGYGGYGGTVIREGPVEGAVVYTGSGATFSSRALEEGGGYGTKVRYVSDGDGGCCSMRNLMMYSTMLAIAIIQRKSSHWLQNYSQRNLPLVASHWFQNYSQRNRERLSWSIRE